MYAVSTNVVLVSGIVVLFCYSRSQTKMRQQQQPMQEDNTMIKIIRSFLPYHCINFVAQKEKNDSKRTSKNKYIYWMYFQLNLHKNLFAEGWYSIIVLLTHDFVCVCVLSSIFLVLLFLFSSHIHNVYVNFCSGVKFLHKFAIITATLDEDVYDVFFYCQKETELAMLAAINGSSNGIPWA